MSDCPDAVPTPTFTTTTKTPDGARLAVFVYAPFGVIDEPVTPYAIYQDGPPVLMLHGNGEDHHDFDLVIGSIASETSVICFDARGQGASSRGSRPLTYELLADDAFQVLDRLGVVDAHVLGFSDGGIEALLMAATHPRRVVSLTCLGANLYPEALTPETRRGIAMTERLSRNAASHSPEAAQTAELMRLMLEQPHIDPSSLGSIACPTWVMSGTDDVVTPEHSSLIAGSIPGARAYVVDGARHDLLHDAPDQVIECLFDAAQRGEDERATAAGNAHASATDASL